MGLNLGFCWIVRDQCRYVGLLYERKMSFCNNDSSRRCDSVCGRGGGGGGGVSSNFHRVYSQKFSCCPCVSEQTDRSTRLFTGATTHRDFLFLYNMLTGDSSENSSPSQCLNSRAEISRLQLIMYCFLNPGGVLHFPEFISVPWGQFRRRLAGKVQENVPEQMKSLCSRWLFRRPQVWVPVTSASLPGPGVWIHSYKQSVANARKSSLCLRTKLPES